MVRLDVKLAFSTDNADATALEPVVGMPMMSIIAATRDSRAAPRIPSAMLAQMNGLDRPVSSAFVLWLRIERGRIEGSQNPYNHRSWIQ